MPTQDPPSARLRSTGSAPRRRSSDPSIRRREDDHKPGNSRFGALLTVVVAVLFLGYVFNIAGFATNADKFFTALNTSAQGERTVALDVMGLLYPAIGLLFAALVLFGVLRWMLNGLKRGNKSRKLAGRDVLSLDTFKRITEARGIRPRIATQAYQLLLPYYSSSMRARLDDRLQNDLQMTPAQIQDVYANLLRNTDRKAPVGEAPGLVSVMDLLNAVQNARRQSLMDSMARPAARESGMLSDRKSPPDPQRDVVSR